MEQNPNQRSPASAMQLRPGQLQHPSAGAVFDLLNLYLGRTPRRRPEELATESPNKLQKRVSAINYELPPPAEQFIGDFEQLRLQFPDHDNFQAITESVVISFVLQYSGHMAQADFLLFVIKNLCGRGYMKWDSLNQSLLAAVSCSESPSSGQAGSMVPTASSQSLGAPSPSISVAPNASNIHPLTPPSPLSATMQAIGSPTQSAIDQHASQNFSPFKSPDYVVPSKSTQSRGSDICYLYHLSCRIISAGLASNLKPATHAVILQHMINWLVNWSQWPRSIDVTDGMRDMSVGWVSHNWMRLCLDVIWTLVDDEKCLVPFYELIRSNLQFLENIPDDDMLFSTIMEIHRRRDMVAMHMQMLDQHLHCPTFATHRFFSQSYPNNPGEPVANLRYAAITYPSVLGEPLHGEDLAYSIQKGSLDWERALRCLRHAIRTTPSPDWWRRVLLVAPCYRQYPQSVSTPGAVFSPDMIGEAVADRTIELLKLTNAEPQCWQEWLLFADLFFFLMKSGCIDFLDFVDKLASRVGNDPQILKSNHVTWLLAQIIRIEIVQNTLSSDPKKVETTRKIISFHKEDKCLDSNNINPQSILLDFISGSQTLRIWSFNPSIREHLNRDHLDKGRQIDEWWKQMSKVSGERIDFMNLDERSMGMFWVLSFTMAQPACEAIMNWFTSVGVTDLFQAPNAQSGERITMMRETYPLSMPLLSGLAINLCMKLAFQLEETIFFGQAIPSIAVVETYVRLLLIAPHALFRPHFTTLTQRSASILSKSGVSLLLLEIMNYRLLPLYRYHGKSKALMYDVTKIISMIKGKRGEHRLFRLAENLCMNLILSIRDFFLVKKELKGPTEFTETLNRITIISLAITIKTRGIAEVEHMIYLQPLLEQIMATSKHVWSEKTMRYFPPLIRELLTGRTDKRGQAIQAWQQAETTVINQCNQLLSPSAEPTYVMTYVNHSFPQHRHYLCAGAWMLMNGHPDSINSANLARVLREFSPEEVTSNIYTMVDVLLHHIQLELQRGHSIQELLAKAIANLAFFIWTHELLPLDILLLALIDRDDDPYALRIVISLLERPEIHQRIKIFCSTRSPDHWLKNQVPKRAELQKALGNHLSWKDRYPPFFDDIAARLLPVIPLIVYRLIENEATEIADRVLAFYSSFLAFHPLKFTFVRDILAYFYGLLPNKLIVRLLHGIGISKLPFSESFSQYISLSNTPACPPLDYFANLLLGLVINVIPPLSNKSRLHSMDCTNNSARAATNKPQVSPQAGSVGSCDGQKAFYQNQDPGSYTQLFLETAAIEILSLPTSASQIVSSLVQIVVHIQSTLLQSNSCVQPTTSGLGPASALPTSPSGGGADPTNANRNTAGTSGINMSNFTSRSGYSCQQLSVLMIQACGLLLAQLPQEFHIQLYTEASRIIKDCWWASDSKMPSKELNSIAGYALLDPTWASQDNTSTAVGNIVALLHAFFSNLPQEWLESTHTVIKLLRPVTSVVMLRIAFRILGPLLPRLAFARPLFMKTLALLFNVLGDVFGKNSQSSDQPDASEITDIIDFVHHAVMYEGQGGPVQSSSKPKLEILTLCGKVIDILRPDVRHLFSHLKTDTSSSIYAATHPKLVPNTT